MNADLVLPLVTSLAWLVLVASALASHRLGWGRMVRIALIWIVIFGAIYLVAAWFTAVHDTASGFV